MISVAINVAIVVCAIVVQLMMLDDYIKKLVRREVKRLCNNCEFKKSKIPEGQSSSDILEF